MCLLKVPTKYLKHSFIILLFSIPLLAISLSVSKTSQATEKRNNSPVILILGDSLSAAHGISQKSAWPNLLQKRLIQERSPYKVINASISGETTSGGLSRTDHVLATHLPDVVILELGANDGLRGLPITQIKTNLSLIISKSKKIGAKVLLVGMQIPPNYGFDYTQSFRNSFTSLANEYELKLVPFLLENVSEHKMLMQDDGLHPRANAQPIILNNLWPYLKTLIEN